ncbi:21882_t:CDS:2 [Rhizophagus irregularis]|nr:21882_t:CDS:2 [Rhizophagus irregularis]
MGKINKKKSSQQSIPVQEFVDAFTNSFASILGDIIFDYIQCGDVESLFYTTATAKLVLKDDIVTERSILDNIRITKLFMRTLNQVIISGARCKARQQLDSLNSRYQNALPLLIQNAAEAQLKKKEKKVSKQKVPVSDDTDANLVIDEFMNIDDNVHGKHQLIAYFETHEHLLRCMEFKHHWKLTISTPPTKKIPQKSKKDKKSYSQQSKGKNLGKSLSPSTHLRNKSNTQQKTDNTHSLLIKLLNLLAKLVALISFVGPKTEVNLVFKVILVDR